MFSISVLSGSLVRWSFFFFQAEDGIRDGRVTGVQTCALPICMLLLAACAGSGPSVQGSSVSVTGGMTEPQGKAPTAILRVPEDYPTIQAAVNAAKPYALISIAPGIYHEVVTVRTAHLTIRGRDRNGVILDGNFKLTNGFEVVADNVVLENMTARHYVGNGFYWTGITGFRGSYLTAYANGDYGLYTYNS